MPWNTDMDVGNQAALRSGANELRQIGGQSGGWSPMSSAPRDGTVVELKCSYGVAPWYGLFRWTNEKKAFGNDGEIHAFPEDKYSWVDARPGKAGGPFQESSLEWRQFSGDPAIYADPTGGMQDSPAYWRGAVAAKYHLPLNYFEKETAANVARHSDDPTREEWPASTKKGWFGRLLIFLGFYG